MDREQPTSSDSKPLAPYRGPFTLGLSRLSRSRSQSGALSRTKSIGCFALALAAGLLASYWLMSAPVKASLSAGSGMVLSSAALATPELLAGGIGLFFSVSLSLAGLWLWPFAQRVKVQPREESLAAYDHVTGLPALRLFTVLLEQGLTRASHMGRSIGVLVADLHQFRPLPVSEATPNMSLVVRVQAARIKSAVPSHNTVARIGDRRFAILIENVMTRDQIDTLAQNIYRTMSLPLMIEGQEVLLTCQIGGVMSAASAASGESLLSQAVKTLALATSENPIRFFDSLSDTPSTSSTAAHQVAGESLLR
ncbi:MAG: diguanylate cyclase [Nitrospira sp.]|nr:diguanylate cyclase [Nitrospira sp.]